MKTDAQRAIDARLALWAGFFVMGVVSMAWVPRIPEMKDAIGLSNGQFGFVFVGGTLGAVCGAQLAGRAIHTFGSRPVVSVSIILMPTGLILMGLANSALSLITGLFVMGLGYALTDMSVNSQAVVVEKILQQKWMSSFHGMWSAGAFVTTVFGGAVAAHFSPRTNLVSIGIVCIFLFIPTVFRLLPPSLDEHAGEEDEETEAKIPFFGKSVLPLWAIGLGLIAGMVSEGAASDWGAILLRDNMGIGRGLNASAFACFALAMITSRFLGDKAYERFGPHKTVKLGGYIGGAVWGSCIAIAVPLSSHNQIAALIIADIGFIFAGLGIGPMFPAFILAASRVKGIASAVAISRVGVIGIAGFFIGPTLTGLIAQATSLSWAMTYPVGMMLLAGFMSRAITE